MHGRWSSPVSTPLGIRDISSTSGAAEATSSPLLRAPSVISGRQQLLPIMQEESRWRHKVQWWLWWSPRSPSSVPGHHQLVPHATFGVIMVEEVPQVDPLHLQASLQDPGGTQRFGRSMFKPVWPAWVYFHYVATTYLCPWWSDRASWLAFFFVFLKDMQNSFQKETR